MQTRQAILTAPYQLEVRETDITPGAGQVLVRIAVCGLCNWELNHWKGIYTEHPYVLGHEWAGTVAEVGAGVTSLRVGDPVTGLGMGGFADYLVVGADGCCQLDPRVHLDQALGEPLKCVTTVLRAAAPEAGDSGVVLGCGPMGLWCLQVLAGRLLDNLIAVDTSPARLALAQQFGATTVLNPTIDDVPRRLAELTNGHDADFVIEGTGVPEVANLATTYLRQTRGRFVVMSSYERACPEFDLRPLLERGAQIFTVHPAYSLNERDDMRRASRLLSNGVFRMEGLITHRFSLARIQDAFQTLASKPVDYLKGVVIP